MISALKRDTSISGSEEREAEDRQFWDGAIHDLRAGLRRIRFCEEMIARGASASSDSPDAFSDFRGHVTDMEGLVSSISGYAAAGTASGYAFTDISAALPLQDAIDDLRMPISDAAAKIDHNDLPVIFADREKLAQLFSNLIRNALLFKGEQQLQITVSSYEDQGRRVFSFADNGIGIEEKYRSRVFAPFYRLHGSSVPGHGLGLAICRRIVEAHGGKIWIGDTQGQGTVVLFTLS